MDSLRKTSSSGIIVLLGGLFFWSAFQFIYSQLNSDWYILRDDAVITFSHAKNWFDFGFIGVSPSGERVEGYSAPVQFFIFVLAYALGHISFVNFDCGHIKSERFGGSNTLDNLKPICRLCNNSMGTTNMNEFMKEYGFYNSE